MDANPSRSKNTPLAALRSREGKRRGGGGWGGRTEPVSALPRGGRASCAFNAPVTRDAGVFARASVSYRIERMFSSMSCLHSSSSSLIPSLTSSGIPCRRSGQASIGPGVGPSPRVGAQDLCPPRFVLPVTSASRDSQASQSSLARAVVDESGGVPTRTLQIGSHPLAQAHPFVAAPAAKKREPCPPSFAPAAPASPVRCSPAPAATPPCPRSWCVSVRSPPARRPVREPHPPIFSP